MAVKFECVFIDRKEGAEKKYVLVPKGSHNAKGTRVYTTSTLKSMINDKLIEVTNLAYHNGSLSYVLNKKGAVNCHNGLVSIPTLASAQEAMLHDITLAAVSAFEETGWVRWKQDSLILPGECTEDSFTIYLLAPKSFKQGDVANSRSLKYVHTISNGQQIGYVYFYTEETVRHRSYLKFDENKLSAPYRNIFVRLLVGSAWLKWIYETSGGSEEKAKDIGNMLVTDCYNNRLTCG